MSSQLRMPLAPMEATSVEEIPVGPDWQYEPKWDGFRCIAFRHGNRIQLQSKSLKPLARYFPEVVTDLARLPAADFTLDGELVISNGRRLSFDDLLMRIHPANSRIKKLAEETPATYIVFDLVENSDGDLLELPLKKRRRQLEAFAKRQFERAERIVLSPATRDVRVARRWFGSAGKSLDGIIAKRTEAAYHPGDRTVMQKIKRQRTADCVVGGFRYAVSGRMVGSLLLGLYDGDGRLNHVGFTSNIARAEKKALTQRLEQLIEPPGFTGSAPGGPSRWSTKRSSEWQPLRPQLVVEVQYDHFSGGRFRHGTRLLRWRPDKAPQQCTMEQVASRGAGPIKLLRPALLKG